MKKTSSIQTILDTIKSKKPIDATELQKLIKESLKEKGL